MNEREKIIRLWFDMWIKKADLGIDNIFTDDVVYTESWSPKYENRKTVKHWFDEWNTRGSVLVWEIKQFFHQGNQTIVEWYFKSKMNNGNVEEFDGISLIVWTQDNKIKSLKEFGCNLHNYNPYRDPAGILNSAFPNDPLFVESVLHRLSSEALCLPQEDAVELERLITMVLNECQTKHEYHKAVEQNLMTSLLLLITRSYTEKKTHIRPMTVGLQQIIPAIEYIGMHYMNPISGEDLASICSLSEAQLRRKFKEYLNMSPVEYLTMVRIQKAYELLNSTNYPMTEVALRVGYQDVSSFNRNFQKIMGVSPYQYKKNNSDYRGRVLDKKISAKKGWKHPSDP